MGCCTMEHAVLHDVAQIARRAAVSRRPHADIPAAPLVPDLHLLEDADRPLPDFLCSRAASAPAGTARHGGTGEGRGHEPIMKGRV